MSKKEKKEIVINTALFSKENYMWMLGGLVVLALSLIHI